MSSAVLERMHTQLLSVPALLVLASAIGCGSDSGGDGSGFGGAGGASSGSGASGGTSSAGSAGTSSAGGNGGSSSGGSGQQGGSAGNSSGSGGSRAGSGGSAGSSGSGGTSSSSTCSGLTDWEQMMLDDHNRWRDSADPPAADMHRVYWDRNIAANAAAWVASCDPDWPHSPDNERSNIGGYEILGENLSYCAGTGCSELPMVQDDSGLGDGVGWHEERHDYDWATDESSGVTSHYTQLMSSNVYAIGCATQQCDAPGPFGWDGKWWWTICQYGPRGDAYWVGNKPYEAGSGGLVEPPDEVWDNHDGLCRE